MALYFFHVRGREGDILDPDGSDLASMVAVRAEALGAVRDLVAESVKAGNGARSSDVMRVEDETGAVVYTLGFVSFL